MRDELCVAPGLFKIVLPTPFPVGDVNVYLVEGEQLTLIDVGAKTEQSWDSFRHQLNQIGYKPEEIEQVILTHHHPDHVGMLDFFRDDLPVIGHWRIEPWISQDDLFFTQYVAFFTTLFHQAGIDPYFLKFIPALKSSMKYSCRRSLTGTMTEGDAVPGLPGWRVVETPGHAQSHIIFYNEAEGLVIGGDFLIKHISSNPLLEPPYVGESERAKPQLQYNASLKKALGLPMDRVLTGHGHDVSLPHSLIEIRLQQQHERAMTIYEWLKERPMTAFAVCKKLFPTVFQKELGLTMSETIGQLDYLESLGLVKIDKTSKAWCYYTV